MGTYKHTLPYYYWRSVNNRESYHNYDLLISRVNKHIDKYNWLCEEFDVPIKLLVVEDIASHKKSYPEAWDINLRILKYDKRTTRADIVFEQRVRKIDFEHSFDYELTDEEKAARNPDRPNGVYTNFRYKRFKGSLIKTRVKVHRRNPNAPFFAGAYRHLRYRRLPIFEASVVLQEYSNYLKGLIKVLGRDVLPLIGDAYSKSVNMTPMIGITKTNDKHSPWSIFINIKGAAKKLGSYADASKALLGLMALTQSLYRQSHGDMHHLLE